VTTNIKDDSNRTRWLSGRRKTSKPVSRQGNAVVNRDAEKGQIRSGCMGRGIGGLKRRSAGGETRAKTSCKRNPWYQFVCGEAGFG